MCKCIACLRLHTLEISPCKDQRVDLQLDLFLPVFLSLQNLRMKTSGFVDVTSVLYNTPNVTSLSIHLPDSVEVIFPTDPACYASLKQISIDSSLSTLSSERILAFPVGLSDLYLKAHVSSPLTFSSRFNSDVRRFSQLCDCSIYALSSCSTPRTVLPLKDYGMCGKLVTSDCNNCDATNLSLPSLWPCLEWMHYSRMWTLWRYE